MVRPSASSRTTSRFQHVEGAERVGADRARRVGLAPRREHRPQVVDHGRPDALHGAEDVAERAHVAVDHGSELLETAVRGAKVEESRLLLAPLDQELRHLGADQTRPACDERRHALS
jgi:hypothetical protein